MRLESRPWRRGEEPQKRQISLTAKPELPSEVDANVLNRRSVDSKHQLVRFSGLGVPTWVCSLKIVDSTIATQKWAEQ